MPQIIFLSLSPIISRITLILKLTHKIISTEFKFTIFYVKYITLITSVLLTYPLDQDLPRFTPPRSGPDNNYSKIILLYFYELNVFVSMIDENHFNFHRVLLTDWMNKPDLLPLPNNFDGLLRGFQETPTREEQPSYNTWV